MPPGFLGIDIAHALKFPIVDPDKQNTKVDPTKGKFTRNSLINKIFNKDPQKQDILVAANGGSDLIYLPKTSNNKALARQIVSLLLRQDYVSGLFVNDTLGLIAGTLPISSIGLRGAARTPTPSIVVNFKSFDTGCGNPTACGAVVADTALQQGQGQHGSFSRADTYNNMTAIGPDFKQGFVNSAPVSNADVAPTVAKVLNLRITERGKLKGRVLAESLVGGPSDVKFKAETLQSRSADNGVKTVLKYQVVGKTRYFDVAGFPGRTLGL